MSGLLTPLTDAFGPLAPAFLILIAGAGLLAFILPSVLQKRIDPLDKLKALRSAPSAETMHLREKSGAAAKLDKYAQYLEPQDMASMSKAKLMMMRAGYRSKNAVRIFHFAKFSLGLGGLLLGVVYTLYLQSQQGELPMKTILLHTIIPGGIGYYLPQYWVQRRLQTRQQEIIAGFADALDLMLVCVEAGQSLDQSINRVAKEMRNGYKSLAEEFEIVAQEVKAGKERVQVLKDMSERIAVPDVSSFITTLIQSATFGTSISDALRVYVAEMRDKRVMRAEEKANTLPTKLSLGTMVFTLPPLMVMLVGPSVYSIAAGLSGG
ncbi:type II secretion system F family protein [Gemmobacter serpentinus]|uniref:type II secretion system F family protein n=1 Tax=Gemmobacter serpentinus TaxID=2652247 RepID=UPI00124DA938|nr:type II secretion system F family protein [Gemmobacter serpentinus]